MLKVSIWTDGAISGNGKPGAVGGWGAILKAEVNGKLLKEMHMEGSKRGTTNNEMELMAIYEALLALKIVRTPTIYRLYSDSEYCVKAFNGRTDKYEHEGWKPRPNGGLLRLIHELNKQYHVQFIWIPREQNDEADSLAKAAKEQELKLIEREREKEMVGKI